MDKQRFGCCCDVSALALACFVSPGLQNSKREIPLVSDDVDEIIRKLLDKQRTLKCQRDKFVLQTCDGKQWIAKQFASLKEFIAAEEQAVFQDYNNANALKLKQFDAAGESYQVLAQQLSALHLAGSTMEQLFAFRSRTETNNVVSPEETPLHMTMYLDAMTRVRDRKQCVCYLLRCFISCEFLRSRMKSTHTLKTRKFLHVNFVDKSC